MAAPAVRQKVGLKARNRTARAERVCERRPG